MKTKIILIKNAALASLLALFLSACSGVPFLGNNDDGAEEIVADQTLYNQGIQHVNEKDYKDAVEKFNQLERQHPYSELAPKSLLMATYSNYAAGKYDDAVETGRRYKSLYPGTDDTAYAMFLVADSHYKQIKSVSQDQENTYKALAGFKELVEQFPESKYAPESREKILMTEDHLAGKEMSVGRYYLNQRRYLAAISRFRTVVDKFQKTRHIEEALARLTESYLSLGVINEAQTAAAILGQNYPQSSWYKDSYRLLQSQNLLPKADPNSWLIDSGKNIKS